MAIARAYPKAVVDGIDLDEASIAAAKENLAGSGLEDRVTFHHRDAADAGLQGQYDLVYIHEALHDMSYPVDVLRACRGLLAEGGTVVVGDERVADSFPALGDDVERMYYGFSILHCLPVGMVGDGARHGDGHACGHGPALRRGGRLRRLRGAADRERLLPVLQAHAVGGAEDALSVARPARARRRSRRSRRAPRRAPCEVDALHWGPNWRSRARRIRAESSERSRPGWMPGVITASSATRPRGSRLIVARSAVLDECGRIWSRPSAGSPREALGRTGDLATCRDRSSSDVKTTRRRPLLDARRTSVHRPTRDRDVARNM